MDLPDERTLAHLWRFGTWPNDLQTTSGARLEIIHRGRPAGGPGPDFCDALLRLDEGPLRSGDVELHVRESDWHAHRHAGDPRYARVILHVVWLADGPPSVASPSRHWPWRDWFLARPCHRPPASPRSSPATAGSAPSPTRRWAGCSTDWVRPV